MCDSHETIRKLLEVAWFFIRGVGLSKISFMDGQQSDTNFETLAPLCLKYFYYGK